MVTVRWWWWRALALVAWFSAEGSAGRAPGGSLRGALEALQRRQRAQGGVPQADYRVEDVFEEQAPQQLYEYYGVSAPGGAPAFDENSDVPDRNSGKYVIEYLGGDEAAADYPTNYQVKRRGIKALKDHVLPPAENKRTSAFRERGKHENERLRELFMSKMDNDEQDRDRQEAQFQSDEEYAELLQELWEKYKMTHTPNYVESPSDEVTRLYKGKNIRKRQIPGDYFPSNGEWGPIAFKKKRSADDRIEGETYPASHYGFPFEYQNYPSVGDDEESGIKDDSVDSNDMRDEYTIAFEPIDDEKIRDVGIGNGFYQYKSKKTIPLSKRSGGLANPSQPKHIRRLMTASQGNIKHFHGGMGTDPKVMRDLSNIFGNTPDNFDQIIRKPVKRSGSSDDTSHESKSPQISAISHNNTHHEHNTSLTHEDVSHEKQSQSSVISHPNLSKKDALITKQNGDEADTKPINIKKKSINWSDYFGFDRRKKQFPSYTIPNTEDYLRQQYINNFKQRMNFPSGGYMYNKRISFNDQPMEESDFKLDKASAIEVHEKKSKGDASRDTGLDSIESKLKHMEGDIVDDALKRSGVSDISDVADTDEEREEKERMLTRLAAAYTLEKMRKALEDVKNSLITHKQVEENKQAQLDAKKSDGGDKDKRIAIKKEKVVPSELLRHEDVENEQRAGQFINGAVKENLHLAKQHAANVFAGKESSECRLLEAMLLRCRQVDRYSGVFGSKFVPLCSIHLICYTCSGSSHKMCDEVFLNESSMICEGEPSCRAASMDALAAIRELLDVHADELDTECEACVLESLERSPSLWTAYNLMW